MSLDLVRSTALQAAQAAGAILKEKLGKLSSIDYKGAFNLVTEADKASEAEVIRIIREQFPDHQILGEESGAHKSSAKQRWLIDPLDGTTNYAHSYPFFSVSIGFEDDGEMLLGMVFNPVSNELFHAERGKGAFLNESKIKVSKQSKLAESLLATGFPPDSKRAAHSNMIEFQTLTDLCHGVRRDGSAALDMCFVAAGRLDGFWEFKLSPWDLAAGLVILREAGGSVSDPTGKEFDLNSGHVLATNSLIHEEVRIALEQCKSQAASH
ncbi:MAG: inositol monophosphatase [Candidatus Obscuribacterales bacterium]|nr:inositol monophosphatase [Candidatus Obscuribacterales bacterium]